jgi:hypothetical protein
LDSIPKDCKLLLVSETSPPGERLDERSSCSPSGGMKSKKSIRKNDDNFIHKEVDIGLKSNIFEFAST